MNTKVASRVIHERSLVQPACPGDLQRFARVPRGRTPRVVRSTRQELPLAADSRRTTRIGAQRLTPSARIRPLAVSALAAGRPPPEIVRFALASVRKSRHGESFRVATDKEGSGVY
jgi:hypothetical protein